MHGLHLPKGVCRDGVIEECAVFERQDHTTSTFGIGQMIDVSQPLGQKVYALTLSPTLILAMVVA